MRGLEQTVDRAAMLGRLARDLPAFLRSPLTVERAAEIVRSRLETRTQRFLSMASRAVYGSARSPYRRLLRAAGCEPGDLRALVEREGLEGALEQLAEQGVYISFDEFKGRREIVRGSERFTVEEEDFDPPGLAPHLEARTGGTRGAGTRLRWSLAFLESQSVNIALLLEAHGLSDADHVVWETNPLIRTLRYAKVGRPPVAWFYPIAPLPWLVRALGEYLRLLSRLADRRLPPPIWLDRQKPGPLADWLADRADSGRSVCLTCSASSAVRVAQAAHERGRSLQGVCFFCHSEPFTDAKQRAIEAAGARFIVHYATTELSALGTSCADASGPDDLHFFRDSLALIQRPTPVGEFGLSIEAFYFTSLQPWPPKVALNLEIGDHGRFERWECGCALGAIGLQDHIFEIRSHEKLTSEGMTFVRSRLTQALEDVLPERFGGSDLDYQVLEEEDRDGILRVYLLASPTLGPLDETELKESFLADLARGGELDAYMARTWSQADTLRIRRQTPVATRAGKVFPFHVVQPQSRAE